MIFIGSDHRGFTLKEALKTWFTQRHLEYIDLGAHTSDRSDYPQYAFAVAEAVVAARVVASENVGVLICGSGEGMAIAANKVRGARAALATNEFMARHARESDNANILILASEVSNIEEAEGMILAFLDARFDGEAKHSARDQEISDYEQHHL